MKNKKKASTIAWIYNVSGKMKKYIGMLVIVQILLGISGVYYAVILKNIINAAVKKNHEKFYFGVLMFSCLVIVQIGLRAVNRFLEEYTRSSIENKFKERLFHCLLHKDYETITKTHSGEWMNRLTSDTVVVADGMAQILPGICGMVVKMIGAFIMILILAPIFGYILIPGGALLIFLTYIFRKVLKKLHKQVQQADGILRIFLQESLTSMLVVRVFGKEEQTLNLACKKMNNHKKARMKKNHFSNICNIGFGGVIQGAYVIGVWFCGYGILNGTMSYGTLMAVLQLISQIQSPFANITAYLPKYYAMLASGERLMEIEEWKVDKLIQNDENETKRNKIRELKDILKFYQQEFLGLSLEHCSFTYQSSSEESNKNRSVVLSDVSFQINKGDYVAFTGPSGCGKSTILKILLCLYSLDKGKRLILVKGPTDTNVINKEFSVEKIPLTGAYRKLFAYVPQRNQLMTGTIREIVAFSDEDGMKNEEKIIESLQIACAKEFVEKLPNGIDTVLGEHGLGLSEGQMQRIAIARAIFTNHPILMLDESTSALDEQTEKQLIMNLQTLTQKTVLVVTHRKEIMKICNKEICFSEHDIVMKNRDNAKKN